ncbi:MAG: prepilin peptidase, partial [Deltaproteobacteria bacterium]|nr:prepilin peptidase [Deltaproteobacteria bacterium]
MVEPGTEAQLYLEPFLAAGAFVLGAIVGSFLNVVITRLPKGDSVLYPPSH